MRQNREQGSRSCVAHLSMMINQKSCSAMPKHALLCFLNTLESYNVQACLQAAPS